HANRLGHRQNQGRRRPGPAGLHEAQVAGRDVGLDGQVKLAQPAPLAPLAQQRADRRRARRGPGCRHHAPDVSRPPGRAAITPQVMPAPYLRRNRHRPAGGRRMGRVWIGPHHDEGETDMNDVIARYLDCWNETDPAARRKLIDEVWAPDARYVDPLAGAVDAHHHQARFGWNLGPEGEEPLVVGFDVAETGEDGKISTVLGFLD